MKKLLLILLIPLFLSAHGVGFDLLHSDQVQTITFNYSDGDPMIYCEILIYGPEDEAVEFQNGRTDRKGTFSFLPDSPGVWLVEIKDTKGHSATAQVVVTEKKRKFQGKLLRM